MAENKGQKKSDGSPTPPADDGAHANGAASVAFSGGDSGNPGKKESKLKTACMFFAFCFYCQLTCCAMLVLLIFGLAFNHGALCEHYMRVLRTRFAHTPKAEKVMDDTIEPVIFLCNHRSWGDFWVDSALLGGTSFVSRWAVAVAIPMSAAWGWLFGWIWFFNRNKKHPEGTTKWMKSFYLESHRFFPEKGVAMYPEGHRTLEPKGIPLKPGGLATAFSMGWPVQVVISKNKEQVMAERSLYLHFGSQIVTSVSKPLRPKDFATADEFIDAVRTTWSATWEDAYTAEPVERATPLLPGAVRQLWRPAITGRRPELQWVRLGLVVAVVALRLLRS